MADLVMGAMGILIPKLGELLKDEYKLQAGVKERISSLAQELEVAQAALHKVAQVPWDQLDEHVQIWARQVREASYDMEDVLDTFLVRVQGPPDDYSPEQEKSFLKSLKKMTNLFKKSKARRKISGDVEVIMTRLQEVTERCRRYKVDDIAVARPATTTSTVDPRLHAMYNRVKNLVGTDKSSGELISMLQSPNRNGVLLNPKMTMMKVVSVVGVGGLGKTTLAKAVYDKLNLDYDCKAFVPVGRNPDLKKVFKDILIDLDEQRNLHLSTVVLDERQLINKLRSFLENKRYFIVIDDVWEIESWETIKLSIDVDNDCGGRIIITTRNMEVATMADEVYKLQPLGYDSSSELFFTRVASPRAEHADNQSDEISDKFIRKCDGIPLAIITMASLLAGKQREHWSKLHDTIDFGRKDNKEAENTMRILSFSYYDLPSHLRSCLLYLSAFPEDSVIPRAPLVWMWVAEGFVQERQGLRLFEIGEGYFNDLVNKSMIEAVHFYYDDGVILGCRVHDMVLDFIRSMSHEENFLTVSSTCNNDQDTLTQSKVRRLAQLNGTMGQSHQAGNHFDMPKVRSFITFECVIQTLAPLYSFKLLRVLAIQGCKSKDGSCIRIEHLGHLLHLRLLDLSGTEIDKIPNEIGSLRFLQTLDLLDSNIIESPSSSSLPKQLMCLRITFGIDAPGDEFSVERLTSLEELMISVGLRCGTTGRWLAAKELGSLTDLRVLMLKVSCWDDETKRGLEESLRHLHELQDLTIEAHGNAYSCNTWETMELVLPLHLRYLCVDVLKFCKLPSCISPRCLPSLSHLDLMLDVLDEQGLKMLGGLPELRFLGLELTSSSTISIIGDSDAVYFPKLRSCRLDTSMIFFIANKEDKSVSFHMRYVSGEELQSYDELHSDYELESGDELQRYYESQSNDELKISEDEPQGSMSTLSDDDQNNASLCSKGAAATAAAAAAAPSPFMPSLQVLHFFVCGLAEEDLRCCDNLGLENLSSLREINATLGINIGMDARASTRAEAALSRAAQVHPNRPTLHVKYP